jgi:hypothetical protein
MRYPKVNIFQNNLANGDRWQEKLQPKLKQILLVKGLETVKWGEHPELQRRGIDAILKQKTARVELKVRDYRFYKRKDILLETETGINPQTHAGGRPGWFYTTEADLVIYVWKNERGTNLIDGYFICMTEDLREWFRKNEHGFQELMALSLDRETGQTWITKNRAVPIGEFPVGSLVQFDPALTAEEQLALEDFREIKIEPIAGPTPKIGDTVELVSGPFRGERARVIRVDGRKGELTVELSEATVPIPVTVRCDSVKVIQKREK